MQISKILSVPTYKNVNFKAKQTFEENKVQTPITTSSVYDSGLGREIVKYNPHNSFESTLSKNYFKLPPMARPDKFQVDAGKALYQGKNVIVEAPTGTGKTAIGQYAITNNMENGKTTFYTTPLKALSNQKLNEFRNIYGDENVGILTGDRRENVDAPIIIMTTEVYRNMALANKYGDKNPLMENLGTVILDEAHYLGDPDRGPVWEESIMYTPDDVQILGLSATIGNPAELTNWIDRTSASETQLVSIPEEARHVPLHFDMLDTISYQTEQKRADNKLKRTGIAYETSQDGLDKKPVPSDFKLAVDTLKNKEQLPAIFFVFSRNYSRQLLDYLGQEGQSLTTEAERKEIENILDSYKAKGYIGSDLNEQALMKGYVIHNAGIIPAQKELIEELFQKKLVKVVLATETLAAGINMPAKTVVISSPYKPTDDVEGTDDEEMSIRTLTANEFKQMSGRAGRRGIDEIGYVYTMPTNMVVEQEFLSLEGMPSNPLVSKYNPDYGFLSGYYEYNTDSTALEELFAKSFYAYSKHADVRAEKQEKLLELADKKSQVLMERGFLDVDEDGNVHTTLLAKMAAKVRGYDAITLVETIANKTFKGISPEALAAVAGSIANPPNTSEDGIGVNENFSYMLSPSAKTDATSKSHKTALETEDILYNRLFLNVQSTLKKLGATFEQFGAYDEVLEFAQSVERPDADEYEIARKLKTLRSIQSKGETITKKVSRITEEYSIENLIVALKNGNPIPTDVLNMYLTEIDKYMSNAKTDDIPTYLETLKEQRAALDNAKIKGNKEKSRLEKHKAGLDLKIKKAEEWKYVSENIYDVISSNKQFVKANNLPEVAKELKDVESVYAQLTAKDKLVKAIKGLISLEDYGMQANPIKDGYANMGMAQDCMNALINTGLEVYATETECEVAAKPQKYGRDAAKNLYKWALINKMNSDSMTNWLELLGSIPERGADEGTIYRRVMQTADLVSQIGEIATVGYKEAQTEEDKAYYAELKQTASQTRDLLIREPATV